MSTVTFPNVPRVVPGYAPGYDPNSPVLPGLVRIKAVPDGDGIVGSYICPPDRTPNFHQDEGFTAGDGEIKTRRVGYVSYRIDVDNIRTATPPELLYTAEERAANGVEIRNKDIVIFADPPFADVPPETADNLIARGLAVRF